MSRPSDTGFAAPRVNTTEPLNVESDLTLQQAFHTSTTVFFIRSHFPIPDPAAAATRLTVDGEVERPLSFGLDDLRAIGTDEATVTIECAGNGRAHLDPPVHGVQWVGGAVGTATWQGVRLVRLLDAAGLMPGVRGVSLRGADQGPVATSDGDRRVTSFERSVPIEKAIGPDVLVAWGMNGAPIPREHGGPLRAIVAGWYGMASVKWLTGITVSEERQRSHWDTDEYSFQRVAPSGDRVRVPVADMLPKSQITAPEPGAAVPLGRPVVVRGLAWAGEAAVAGVELSADSGMTWSRVRLLDVARPNAWVRWEADWIPSAVGPGVLLTRCRDDRGRTQPMTRDRDRGTYMVNEVVPYPVTVRP